MNIAELVQAVDATPPMEALPSTEERRATREAAGVTLQAAAMAVGVNVNTLHAWERGERQPRLVADHKYRKLLAACRRLKGSDR